MDELRELNQEIAIVDERLTLDSRNLRKKKRGRDTQRCCIA
jgi:hypothetical protein